MAAERDPHGIVPDGFYDEWSSIQRAAFYMDRAGDILDENRCPDCASAQIKRKPEAWTDDAAHKVETAYCCQRSGCRAHFRAPAPSANEEGVPEHDGCGRKLHVRRVEAGRFRCDRCDEIFETTEGEE
jgi:ribosomal protein L37AE/L43A